MKNISQILCVMVLFISCSENTAYKEKLREPELFQSAVKILSDIIVYDIFSPPVASRVYMYPTIAAYEIMSQAKPTEYKSLATQLNGLEEAPKITWDVNSYRFMGSKHHFHFFTLF